MDLNGNATGIDRTAAGLADAAEFIDGLGGRREAHLRQDLAEFAARP